MNSISYQAREVNGRPAVDGSDPREPRLLTTGRPRGILQGRNEPPLRPADGPTAAL